MRRFILPGTLLRPVAILALFAPLFLGGCAPDGAQLLGRPAPETRFTLLEGDYIALKSYRGKTVVVAFWAQWCTSSGPTVKRLQELAATLDRDDVVFLAASLDEVKDVGKLKDRIVFQRLDELEHAFSGNAGGDEAFIAFEGRTLPYVVIIDPAGTVRATGHSDSVVRRYLEAPGS
jgi:peroxiredoxin